MRVRYTLRARGDLDAIYNFIDERNPTLAQSVKDLIEHRIAGLAEFPYKARFNKETWGVRTDDRSLSLYCILRGRADAGVDHSHPAYLAGAVEGS